MIRERNIEMSTTPRGTNRGALLAFFVAAGSAMALDFRGVTIVVPADATAPQKTAARMLSEEITKRAQLKLNVLVTMPAEGPVIFLRTGSQPGPEGFTLTTSHENERPIATVKGFDDRGIIFGAGYLLRQFQMGRQRLELATE